MNEEHLESFAGGVIGAFDFVDLENDVKVIEKRSLEHEFDMFGGARLVSIADAEGSVFVNGSHEVIIDVCLSRIDKI